jgi:hypothetical protein
MWNVDWPLEGPWPLWPVGTLVRCSWVRVFGRVLHQTIDKTYVVWETGHHNWSRTANLRWCPK